MEQSFFNSQTLGLGLCHIVNQVYKNAIDALDLQQTDKELIKYDEALICQALPK